MNKEDYEKQFEGWIGDEESIKIEQAKLKHPFANLGLIERRNIKNENE